MQPLKPLPKQWRPKHMSSLGPNEANKEMSRYNTAGSLWHGIAYEQQWQDERRWWYECKRDASYVSILSDIILGYFEGHYNDAIMNMMRLESPASQLFTQLFFQAQITESIKIPRHWPLFGEFTSPQLRRKCFHLITSSCNRHTVMELH